MAFRSTWSPNFDMLNRPGNQGIAIGNNTLAAWFRWDDVSGLPYEVIEINDSGGSPFASAIVLNGNQIEFIQRNAAGTGLGFLSAAITANTWYHAALTWDGTTLTGYLNGQLVNTATGLTGTRGNWAELQIGPGNGYLQDGVFYTVALSAQEVQQLYAQRMPRRRDGLRHWIPCFPGSGRGQDYSGNNLSFSAFGTPTDPGSSIALPQAIWGTGAPTQLYSDASGATPLPIDGTAATRFGGALDAGKAAFVDGAAAVRFGGALDAGKTIGVAGAAATQYGGVGDVQRTGFVGGAAATAFGGSVDVTLVKYAAGAAATQFGGTADATGGGGGGGGTSHTESNWRRGPRYGR